MAAVTKLGLLLIVFISGIHGEDNFYIIIEKGGVYNFRPPKEANFCVISRSIGEENLVLWNTSDLSPENPALPEDLKKRLEVSYEIYMIHNLTHSDSGLYRGQCWTDGNVTYQQNLSITVCSTIHFNSVLPFGDRTAEIPCMKERVADNQTVQWFREEASLWTRMFMDDNKSLNPLMKDLEGKIQLVENSSSLIISNFTRRDDAFFTCLVMEKQRCVRGNSISFYPQIDIIFRFVGEAAVLLCFDTDLYGPPACWRRESGKPFIIQPSQNYSECFSNLIDREQQYRHSDDPVVSDNFSLVFSSVTLNHSDVYHCVNEQQTLSYLLHVCPESPPLTRFFSDGEEVTLNCDYSKSESRSFAWFRRTAQEDVISDLIFALYRTMVLSNLSAEDSGEYWCVLFNEVRVCESTSMTILIYKHPFGIYSTFYAVWSSLMSCGLLGMVCAVVTVNVKYRRREQVPVI